MGKKKLSELSQALDEAQKKYQEELEEFSRQLEIYSQLIADFSAKYELNAEEAATLEAIKTRVIELKQEKEKFEQRAAERSKNLIAKGDLKRNS